MEFFIPGLLLFLFAVALTFIIAPRFTPLATAILSIVFLSYGVYEHYKMFAVEYRLSTWQQSLKIYAPALMISAIIIYIIYGILAFFTTGGVPVPPIPNITLPNTDSVTNQLISTFNNVGNILGNKNKNQGTNIIDELNNQINKANKSRTDILGLNANKVNEENKNNKNKNNLSRSFLETI